MPRPRSSTRLSRPRPGPVNRDLEAQGQVRIKNWDFVLKDSQGPRTQPRITPLSTGYTSLSTAILIIELVI